VLGPGSLFTSIIPNLLVPGVLEAIRSSRGKTLFVCSLADMQGETWGLSAYEHVKALMQHGMDGLLDFVLVHSASQLLPAPNGSVHTSHRIVGHTKGSDDDHRIRSVEVDYEMAQRIQSMGPIVIARNFVDPLRPTWHDPKALRDAFTGVLRLCRSPQM
jgi:uncharacterized cofD-like protein